MDDGSLTSRLLRKRQLFVTGKGGVGKSTVAATLGLLAARRGLRTIVAEVSGRGDVPRLFSQPQPGPGERELVPGVWSIAIEPQRAMEEYLIDQLPVRAVADLLAQSRAFGYLAAATPGLRELLTVGKVWELAQPQRRAAGGEPYDLVIVDAPATGHGVGLLAAPRTFANVAAVGPVARHAHTIELTLKDPTVTGVVAVSTPQEPAVNETLALRDQLDSDIGMALDAVIVNALHPWRFTPRDAAALHAALDGEPPPAAREALEVALAEDRLIASERAQLRRLREQLAQRPAELPFLFVAELGLAELDQLSLELEAAR
jgi:anion-transporting  ArsA/GET3 family ATPase